MTPGHRLFCKEFLCFDTIPCRHMPLFVHFCTWLHEFWSSSNTRKTDSIHHHHPEGVVYRSFCFNSSTVAVSKVTSRRWWCIESLPKYRFDTFPAASRQRRIWHSGQESFTRRATPGSKQKPSDFRHLFCCPLGQEKGMPKGGSKLYLRASKEASLWIQSWSSSLKASWMRLAEYC